MIVKEMEKINSGNPFLGDAFHMGVQIGTNCHVMMPNFESEFCKYLIVVDTTTGERIKIMF